MSSRAVTPFYLDKAFYLTVVSLLLPYLSPLIGVQLDPVKLSATLVVVATYIASHKWKSASIVKAELALDAQKAAQALWGVTSGPVAAVPPTVAPAPEVGSIAPLKVLLAVLALGVAFHPAPAHAQVLVSSGPTLPLLELRPGQPHPIQLAPGAGIQMSFTEARFTRELAGKAWDLLDVNLMAFGTAVSASSGASFGALSAAVGVCTLSTLLCVGAGHDVVTGGALKPGFFGLLALNFNFALGPTSPPVGIEKGAAGLARANTLYFGAL